MRVRYASIRELAWDLQHPETVGVADRAEPHDWKSQRMVKTRRAWFYVLLMLLPLTIFATNSDRVDRAAAYSFPGKADKRVRENGCGDRRHCREQGVCRAAATAQAGIHEDHAGQDQRRQSH